jgi:hypothetical protein
MHAAAAAICCPVTETTALHEEKTHENRSEKSDKKIPRTGQKSQRCHRRKQF